MMIESDFYATDAGRQHFADQLKSIRYVRALHLILKLKMSCSHAIPYALCSVSKRPATSTSSTPCADASQTPISSPTFFPIHTDLSSPCLCAVPHLRQLRLQLR